LCTNVPLPSEKIGKRGTSVHRLGELRGKGNLTAKIKF